MVIAWNIFQLLVEVKPMKKIGGSQIGSEIKVFVIFSRLYYYISLLFPQDCSLGQCITSSNSWPKLGSK